MRVVQGLAFGAEWGGAILMTFEHAPRRERGLYTGITQAGFPVGLLLANLAFLASVPLGDTWAWRVPFLLSALLIVVGITIRLKVEESPGLEELKADGEVSQHPLREVVRDDWRGVLRAFCVRIAETAGYAVSVTFLLSCLVSEDLARRSVALTALPVAVGLGIFATLRPGRAGLARRRPGRTGHLVDAQYVRGVLPALTTSGGRRRHLRADLGAVR